jgi:YD repeat-containing protein
VESPTYNAASEITSVTDPDSTITYTRDNLGRATGVSNAIAGLTPTVALTQAFDAETLTASVNL